MRKNAPAWIVTALLAFLFLTFFSPARVQAAATQNMYRLYNPNSGEHFYTAAVGERDYLERCGWNYEGIGWVAPASSNTPVYRLYNPNAGDHHYTMNPDEKNMLVHLGWNYEGIGWYSDDQKRVPLYREYNPNAIAGSHNYTTRKAEHDYLVSIGWRGEGIAWYGVKGSSADTSPTTVPKKPTATPTPRPTATPTPRPTATPTPDPSIYTIRNWANHMRMPSASQINSVKGTGRSPYIAIYPHYPDVTRALEFCVDFHADHQPKGTYLCPMNWWMDVSSLEAKYKSVYNDYTGTPGGYCGFQCWEDGSRVFIMTVWTIFCEDSSGNVTTLKPEVIYPAGAGNENKTNSEGSFVQCILPYNWLPGKDYRVLLQHSKSSTTGNVVLTSWVCDLAAKKWTKLVSFDTGAKDIYMRSCGGFLENYITDYAGEVRTMELFNLRARSASTGKWVAADYTKFLFNGSISDLGYVGSGNYGTDGSSIWAITSGVSGLCTAPSDSVKYYLTPGETSDPY